MAIINFVPLYLIVINCINYISMFYAFDFQNLQIFTNRIMSSFFYHCTAF